MSLSLLKAALIAGTLLLSARSGVSTDNRYSKDTQLSNHFSLGPTSSPHKLNFHGCALGSRFGGYSSGLLRDD
mgnify:CR=1